MANFEPPPTYTEPVVVDPKKQPGQAGYTKFSPIWLKWFIDFTAFVNVYNLGGASASIIHNNTQGLEGGKVYSGGGGPPPPSEYYHLSGAQYTLINVTGAHLVAGLVGTIAGQRSWVTDALVPVFGNAVVGGGAVIIPVFYTGATWIVG